MRAVIQRVKEASVRVDGREVGSIGRGLLVFLGIGKGDDEGDLRYMIDKIYGMRIFEDTDGKMNLSLGEVGGEVLVVSQFTLYGDCRKGKRPSFVKAASADTGREFYLSFIEGLSSKGIRVEQGEYQAMMSVHLVNDGPVTILLDSEKVF